LDPNSPEAQAEVTPRHKAAATTVLGLIVATILLSIIAYLGKPYFNQQPPDLPLDFAVRIVVLVLGLGAVVWRRTKFQPARLKDIAGLQGVSGLVRTIEKTTLQIALMAAAIAVTGFVTTLMTGNELYTFWTGAIAIVVLIYGYPTKSSWLRMVSRYTDPNADVPAPPSTPEQL
jgi:hypothetical protein